LGVILIINFKGVFVVGGVFVRHLNASQFSCFDLLIQDLFSASGLSAKATREESEIIKNIEDLLGGC